MMSCAANRLAFVAMARGARAGPAVFRFRILTYGSGRIPAEPEISYLIRAAQSNGAFAQRKRHHNFEIRVIGKFRKLLR